MNIEHLCMLIDLSFKENENLDTLEILDGQKFLRVSVTGRINQRPDLRFPSQAWSDTATAITARGSVLTLTSTSKTYACSKQ